MKKKFLFALLVLTTSSFAEAKEIKKTFFKRELSEAGIFFYDGFESRHQLTVDNVHISSNVFKTIAQFRHYTYHIEKESDPPTPYEMSILLNPDIFKDTINVDYRMIFHPAVIAEKNSILATIEIKKNFICAERTEQGEYQHLIAYDSKNLQDNEIKKILAKENWSRFKCELEFGGPSIQSFLYENPDVGNYIFKAVETEVNLVSPNYFIYFEKIKENNESIIWHAKVNNGMSIKSKNLVKKNDKLYINFDLMIPVKEKLAYTNQNVVYPFRYNFGLIPIAITPPDFVVKRLSPNMMAGSIEMRKQNKIHVGDIEIRKELLRLNALVVPTNPKYKLRPDDKITYRVPENKFITINENGQVFGKINLKKFEPFEIPVTVYKNNEPLQPVRNLLFFPIVSKSSSPGSSSPGSSSPGSSSPGSSSPGSSSPGSSSPGSSSPGSSSPGSSSPGSSSPGSSSPGSSSPGSSSPGSSSSGSGLGTELSNEGSQYNGGAQTFDTRYRSKNRTAKIAIIDLSETSLKFLEKYSSYLIDNMIQIVILDANENDAKILNKQYDGLRSGPAPKSPEALKEFLEIHGIKSYPSVLEDGWVWQVKIDG